MTGANRPPDPPWCAPTLSGLLRSHVGDEDPGISPPSARDRKEAGRTLSGQGRGDQLGPIHQTAENTRPPDSFLHTCPISDPAPCTVSHP